MSEADDLVVDTFFAGQGTAAVGTDTAANAVDQSHGTILTANKIFLRQAAGIAAGAACSQFFQQSAVSRSLAVGMCEQKRSEAVTEFFCQRNLRHLQFTGFRRIVVRVVAEKDPVKHLIVV